jgi:hypothetical protein
MQPLFPELTHIQPQIDSLQNQKEFPYTSVILTCGLLSWGITGIRGALRNNRRVFKFISIKGKTFLKIHIFIILI